MYYMSVVTSDYDDVRDADVGWNKYSMPLLGLTRLTCDVSQ